MKRFFRLLTLLLVAGIAVGSLSACTSKKNKDLVSPCAGAEGSPCGPKRPVNDWWLHPSDA